MKALLRAMLLLCLFATAGAATPQEPGCIATIKQIDRELKVKGAVLISEMFNHDFFARVYVGEIEKEKVTIFVMAIKSDKPAKGVFRSKCIRETDNASFTLLRLIFPLKEERA